MKTGTVFVLAVVEALSGCGSGSTSMSPDTGTTTSLADGGPVSPSELECMEGRDGWEQCVDNKVQYCHLVSGMAPHFHWGSDCVSLGLSCIALSESKAGCIDMASSCTPGEFKCESNTAHTCVSQGDLGHWVVEPCGTAKTCHVEATTAHCESLGEEECGGHGHLHDDECHCDQGYKVDAANKLLCVAAVDFPTQACTEFAAATSAEAAVSAFADFSKAHMDLDKPYLITLPAGVPSYVHFPVTVTGEYVVFLGKAGVFDTFMHRAGTDVTPAPSGGVANGKCATTITDHWHAALTFDGAATDTKVPYIIRFKAQAVDGTVVVMVKRNTSATEHEHDEDAERLVIVDSVEAKATIFDVTTKASVGSFALGGAATVYAGPGGRYAYLVQGTAAQVQIIDSGLVLEDHGDHNHHEREAPALLTFRFVGDKPVHFVGHSNLVTLFFDGLGVAQVLDERTLLTMPAPLTVQTGQPHHGVALTFGNAILATYPELAEGTTTAKAAGIQVFTLAGVKQGEPVLDCPGLHGEASNASFVAFGCTDGVLLMTPSATGFTSLKVANPPLDPTSTGTAPRVSTAIGHHSLPHFIGSFGAAALAKIDTTGAGAITRIDLPGALATAGYSGFAFDHDGRRILVLGKDGALYALDATTGAALGPPLPVAAVAEGLTPRLAVGKHAVYVSDPKLGTVRMVDPATLVVQDSFVVGGTPGNLAVLSFPEKH